MNILSEIAESLRHGDDERVLLLTRQALAQQVAAKAVLDDGLIAGMNVVGELFKAHEIFLPDVLVAARAMHAGLDVLKPHFAHEGMPTRGRVVIGTVKGDLHDLGKGLVAVMLEGVGFEVIDLGKDVAPETFIQTAVRENARVIGMSALLTTTMPVMRTVVALLEQQDLRRRIKTIIGGAPVTEAYAEEIGADAYAFDAVTSVERVAALME